MAAGYEDAGYLPAQWSSETSVEAASSQRQKAVIDRRRVLIFLLSRGEYGATDQECQKALWLNGNTERPRRIGLTHDKLVVDSGHKRLTKAGRRATVWVVTPAGEALAMQLIRDLPLEAFAEKR